MSVDEAGDGSDTGSVGLSVVTIELRQGLVASQSTDGVFDGDTLGGKRGVGEDVLRWPRLATRLPTRREGEPGRMARRGADVRQVAEQPDLRVHSVEQPRGLQQFQIARRPTHAVGHRDDLA